MKTKLACELLTVFALVFLVPPHSARAGTILWDDTHDTDGDELTGNFAPAAATLAAAGHTVLELHGGHITPAVLSGVNAYFLWDAELPLTSGEISALQDFVAGGGGLFVAYDTGTDVVSNNELLAPYGLKLGSGMFNSTVSDFVSHPITAGINTIFEVVGGSVGTTGSAIDLTIADERSNILAVSAAPRRVVAFGDTTTFGEVLDRFDNRQLLINIANFTAAPEPASVALLAIAALAALPTRRRKSVPHDRV